MRIILYTIILITVLLIDGSPLYALFGFLLGILIGTYWRGYKLSNDEKRASQQREARIQSENEVL